MNKTIQKVNVTNSTTGSSFRIAVDFFALSDWNFITGIMLSKIAGAITKGYFSLENAKGKIIKRVPVELLYNSGSVENSNIFIPIFSNLSEDKKLTLIIEGDAITTALDFDFVLRLQKQATKPAKELNYQTESILISDVTNSVVNNILTLDADFETVTGFILRSNTSGLTTSARTSAFDMTISRDDGTAMFKGLNSAIFENNQNVAFVERFWEIDMPAKGSRINVDMQTVRSITGTTPIEICFSIEREWKN